MKTIKTLFLISLLTFALASQGQTTQLYYKGCGKVQSKTFDLTYGTNGQDKPVGNHFKFCLLKDGNYLYGQDALTEAEKPVWGDNQNRTIEELLPHLTPDVGVKFLYSNNWHPIAVDSLPTTLGTTYQLRVWSGNYSGGQKTYYKSSEMPFESVQYWLSIGFFTEWKQYNLPDRTASINPDWINNEAIRTVERAEYKQIVQEYFALMGDYSFPTFPTNPSALGGCDSWVWKIQYSGESWQTLTVDPTFWLASPNGFPIILYREIPISCKYYNLQWDSKINNTISGEDRVKRLLGM
jgi:hypothetical protein